MRTTPSIIWKRRGLACLLGCWAVLFALLVPAQEAPQARQAASRAAAAEDATRAPSLAPPPPVQVPRELTNLLDRYKQAIEDADLGAIRSLFWDPAPYLPIYEASFRNYELKWNYERVVMQPGETPDQRILLISVELKVFVKSSRQVARRKSLLEFHVEQRQGEWRVISIPKADNGKSR